AEDRRRAAEGRRSTPPRYGGHELEEGEEGRAAGDARDRLLEEVEPRDAARPDPGVADLHLEEVERREREDREARDEESAAPRARPPRRRGRTRSRRRAVRTPSGPPDLGCPRAFGGLREGKVDPPAEVAEGLDEDRRHEERPPDGRAPVIDEPSREARGAAA